MKVICLLVSLVVAVLTPSRSVAQDTRAARAVYTHAQAEAGAEVYRVACADCHLANLRGDFEAPELAGANFRREWGDQPVDALLENIRTTMPEDAPESLSDEEYAAVVAYIIHGTGALSVTSPSTGRPRTAEDLPLRSSAQRTPASLSA